MVEMAFAFPIFIVLLLGLVEGGRFVFYSEVLVHATRDGARYAIIHGQNADDGVPTGPGSTDPSGTAVKDAVRDAATGISDRANIVIPDPEYTPNNNRRGSAVTVNAQYTYTPIVPLFGPITVESEATLVINN
jgi:Flp pilus assembly protein TadG